MSPSIMNRIGKALIFAIFATGLLYVTGYGRFDRGRIPEAAKLALSVLLLFLIFFGIINLLHLLKGLKKPDK